MRRFSDPAIVIPFKGSAWFCIWETPSTPKTAAPLSLPISQYESAARYRISGIAVRLSDRYGA